MDEKLYKLIEIVKGESYNFKFVKKIIFEYDERTYSLTKDGLYPLIEHAGVDIDLTNSLTNVRVKSMEF